MAETFLAGDVRAHTYPGGDTDYIRVGHPNPDGTPSIWVMSCDEQGDRLHHGRYLQANTVAHFYRRHSTPKETY